MRHAARPPSQASSAAPLHTVQAPRRGHTRRQVPADRGRAPQPASRMRAGAGRQLHPVVQSPPMRVQGVSGKNGASRQARKRVQRVRATAAGRQGQPRQVLASRQLRALPAASAETRKSKCHGNEADASDCRHWTRRRRSQHARAAQPSAKATAATPASWQDHATCQAVQTPKPKPSAGARPGQEHDGRRCMTSACSAQRFGWRSAASASRD